jgi:hypothetical protein
LRASPAYAVAPRHRADLLGLSFGVGEQARGSIVAAEARVEHRERVRDGTGAHRRRGGTQHHE